MTEAVLVIFLVGLMLIIGDISDNYIHQRERTMNTVDLRAVQAEQALRKLLDASVPFAAPDWMDAELEDDNCKLTQHSGAVTVGDWRALRLAVQEASAALSAGQRHD